MEYGIKPETSQENELELCRMEELAKQRKSPYRVYKGKTNDINLHLTWFCPHCLVRLKVDRMVVHNDGITKNNHKASKIDQVYAALYCPSHYEVCEYTFYNKDLRRASPTFWSSSFQYPLNPIQAHQAHIEAIKKNIAEQEKKLIELESKTIEVHAEMLC